MNQYAATVAVAIITGLFSLITLIIQKKQDKVIDKIDEKTLFIEKEKNVRKKLADKTKEKESIVHQVMILILDTNVAILKNIYSGNEDNKVIKDMLDKSEKLKGQFKDVSDSIEDITKEYEIILDMSNEVQKEIQKSNVINK